MSLIKHNPFASTHHSFHTLADHFFNGNIGDFIGSDFINNQASANIIETPKAFRIEVAAPGLQKEDFKLHLENNHLKISVEKQKEETDKKQKFTRREFTYNSFERNFKLNDKVNTKEISATYEDGILKVNLLKKEIEQAETKRVIEIS